MVAALWSVGRAMSAEAVLQVRRNAYWWALNYCGKVSWFGDSEGPALWCAEKYVSHLVGKILERKTRVSLAREQQRNATASANEPPPDLPVQPEDETRPGEDQRIRVRLVNAVTGEPCMTVKMSKWMVLGDALAKANSQLDKIRKFCRGVQPDGTPGDEDDRWYFAAQDEVFFRGRIFRHLEPDQEVIEVRVVNLPKKPVTTEWQPPQLAVRPEEVPTKRQHM